MERVKQYLTLVVEEIQKQIREDMFGMVKALRMHFILQILCKFQ